MSELRAPDPTLDALGEPVGVEYWSPDPGVAHRLPDGPGGSMSACGYRGLDAMPSLYAAYVAVPCRECFPDAAPPGREFYNLMDQRNRVQVRTRPVKGLAWQVQS